MPNYGPNLFADTASYYAKYRPKYPPELFADTVNYFGLNGRGDLLDLACGTGELAIPLAQYFEHILALDPEPQMLEQGKLKVKASGISNIDWLKGSSNSLKELTKHFKLVTIGQALHWMNEIGVVNQVYDLLEPGGGLLIVSGGGVSLINPKENAQPKASAIKKLLIKYLGPERRAGDLFYQPSQINWDQDLFPNSKFGKFTKRVYHAKVVRNIEQELGNLYSMSWARREYFGDKIDQFEAEFRRDLAAISPNKKFVNQVVFEAYFLRK